jgi:hypothetical protein
MPVNTMARLASSAARITSSSRSDPPGWMTAVAPAAAASSNPVGERKEGVRRHHRALRQRLEPRRPARLARLPRGDAARIDPRHLARADAHGGAVPGIDDGVRLHVLGDPEGEGQVGKFLRRGARCVTTFRSPSSTAPESRDCTRKPPPTVRIAKPGPPRVRQAVAQQNAQVRLQFERGERRRSAPGAMITSVKMPRRPPPSPRRAAG